MSSQPATQQKVTQQQSTTGPLAQQAPLFADLWSRASTSQVGTPFNGDIVAAPSQYSLAAPGMMANAPVGTNAAATADMAKKVASGYFLDPSNDPTFQGAVNAAINPITRQLTDTVLPQITDASIRNGGTGGGPAAYGGASQDLQENQAVQNWAKQTADTTASMANASRTQGMNLIPQIPSLNQGANAEALAPATAMATAGAADTANKQALLDNIFQKWNVNRQAPLQDLQSLANIYTTGGFRDSSSSGTETTTGSAPSMATQILQGLTGGAGIVGSLFGSGKDGSTAFGNLTGTVSNLLPALMAISDRRLKHGIVKIGEAPDGLGIYMYHFSGVERVEVGFMADEVKEKYPEAVETHHGIDVVNYKLIRERMTAHG